jgi:hypothetical protein
VAFPVREKSGNLKPFDKLKVELTKTKRELNLALQAHHRSINISMFYSNGKFQCLILNFSHCETEE